MLLDFHCCALVIPGQYSGERLYIGPLVLLWFMNVFFALKESKLFIIIFYHTTIWALQPSCSYDLDHFIQTFPPSYGGSAWNLVKDDVDGCSKEWITTSK